MKKIVSSKSFIYNRIGENYEAVNFLSGKAFIISSYIKKLIQECIVPMDLEILKGKMEKDLISKSDIDNLLSFLLRNKLLVSNDKEVLYEPVRSTNHGFFNIPCTDWRNLPSKIISMLGAPFGNGNSFDMHCRDFPDYFRNYLYSLFCGRKDWNKAYCDSSILRPTLRRLIDSMTHMKIQDVGNVPFFQGEDSNLYYDKLFNVILHLIHKECKPFIIGGDHSITYPIVKAFSKIYKDFVILQFDAHADYKYSDIVNMYDEMDIGLLNHATVMNYCEKIHNVRCIYQVGVREPFIVTGEKLKFISLQDMRSRTYVYQDIINLDLPIYLSFDIDYFDPIIAPATSCQIVNGGLYAETIQCLNELLIRKNIIGVDIVEVNPSLDNFNRTTQLTMNLVLQLLNIIEI